MAWLGRAPSPCAMPHGAFPSRGRDGTNALRFLHDWEASSGSCPAAVTASRAAAVVPPHRPAALVPQPAYAAWRLGRDQAGRAAVRGRPPGACPAPALNRAGALPWHPNEPVSVRRAVAQSRGVDELVTHLHHPPIRPTRQRCKARPRFPVDAAPARRPPRLQAALGRGNQPASSVAWDDGYKLTSGRHAVSRSSTRVH
jgi:hypothetical protein